MPAGQVIPTWLPFPDSEDHENLLRKGVTHILSVHNRAEPVLEVRAWVGGLGTTRGCGSWEGTPGSFSWPGQEQCWIYTDFHQFTPIYTNLHRFSPIFTDLHQFAPIYTDFHQFTPGDAAQRNSVMDLGRGWRGFWGITRGFLGDRQDPQPCPVPRCCRGVPTRGRRRPANGSPAGRGHCGTRCSRPGHSLLRVPASPAPLSAAGSSVGKLRQEGAAPGMMPEVWDRSLAHKSCPDGSVCQEQLRVGLPGCAGSERHGRGVLGT